MADVLPVMFRWKTADVCVEGGEIRRVKVMVPHNRYLTLCDQQFDEGEDYALGPIDEIPSKSRAGFFAEARRCFNSLHEGDKRYLSPEHFRKMALIQGGWYRLQQYVMSTPEDAHKIALEARRNPYAVIEVKENCVNIWTAKSIAGGALRGKQWQEVKEAALRWTREQVDPDKYEKALEEEARRRGR